MFFVCIFICICICIFHWYFYLYMFYFVFIIEQPVRPCSGVLGDLVADEVYLYFMVIHLQALQRNFRVKKQPLFFNCAFVCICIWVQVYLYLLKYFVFLIELLVIRLNTVKRLSGQEIVPFHSNTNLITTIIFFSHTYLFNIEQQSTLGFGCFLVLFWLVLYCSNIFANVLRCKTFLW